MSIGKDTAFNLAAAAAPAVCMLVVVPFYLHAIGPERYGVLAVCWTIVAALSFASLGMGPALAYHLASRTEASAASRSSLIWTALALGTAASLVGAFFVVAIGRVYFRYFFPAASSLQHEIRGGLPLLAALLPVAIIVGVLNGALQGNRRFGALSAINIFGAGLIAVTPLTVAFVISIHLPWLILATVIANAVVAIVQLALCARLVPLQVPQRLKRADVNLLLGYGAWMSGTALITSLVMLLDRLVIGALRGPTSVAAYVLPYNLVQQLVLLPASLTSAVLPRVAALPDQDVQQLQSSSLTWLNGVLTPLAIVAIGLAAPFFHFWLGPALGGGASPVAAILLVGGWVHGIGHIPSTVVVGRSRPDLLTKLLLAYLGPYVVILYFATSHFGIIGAAATWTFRAAFDPVLFVFTRPSAVDMRGVAVSALLVLAGAGTALAVAWASPWYWALMLLILAASCYQHRAVLLTSAGDFRRAAFVLARRGADQDIVSRGI